MVEVYKKSYVCHEEDVEIMIYCFGLLQKTRRDRFSSVIIYALLICGTCLQAIKNF